MTRLILVALALGAPLGAHADTEAAPVLDHFEKARVTDATEPVVETIPGTDVTHEVQDVVIRVMGGEHDGLRAEFENDYFPVGAGDIVYVRHSVSGIDGVEMWALSEPYRLPVLGWLLAGFLALLLLFGGWQGVRGLASLIGSLVLIAYVLLPGIYSGYSAVLLSLAVASLIMVFGSYVTHGFTRTTTSAMIGMIGTVLVTGAAAYAAIHLSDLTGFTSEQNVYLNFNTSGRIDMIGLLFGGIMIGLLGVLYDIAIGQAVAVEELYRAAAGYTRREAYTRALRIGREHIGALVNTLAIAYVGASLPLFLLFTQSDVGIEYLANSELFATEIIRILIGSSGLILAVPITTFIAAYLLHGRVGGPAGEMHSHRHS